MKILIIEDDLIKLKAIVKFIQDLSMNILIEERMSYQSGLLAILKDQYDLILLDMQLPNYDIKSGEDGYRLRPVAGRDILRELKRKKIQCSVVIITQYEGFGENGQFESLNEWHKKLKEEFSQVYKSTIRYKPGSNSWKDHLIKFIK